MGRPPIGKRAMTAAERTRRHRERKFGKRNKPTAKTVEQLQARVRELEADYAALYRANEELHAGMERLVFRLMDPAFTRSRRASLNQMNAAARRSRKRGFEDHAKRIVTGYQATCDLMYGPAPAENSARTRRAARKRARAAT
jgi:predicted RNase H-like nuclease (RuvC/YqgF family)